MGSISAGSVGIAFLAADAPRRMVAWSRAAEHAGFDSVWLLEDYFYPGAFALAGAVAAATERVTVGLGVVNPYTRHPALLAMETAGLAGLAPGRVVLGLGASNRGWIQERMGIPHAEPLRSLRECVEIVRRLLAGERLTYRGRRYALDAVRLEWAPPAPVPIFLGVKGPQAVALAGEIADGLHCSVLASPAHVRRVRAETAAAAARRPDGFAIVAYVLLAVDRDGRAARERIRPVVGHYLGLLHGQAILREAGCGPDVTAPFREALAAGGAARLPVPDRVLDAVAVAGTPEECRAALRRFAEAGLDSPIVLAPPGDDVEAQLALVGRELIPYWKELRCA